jgi:hypothetical protein
MDDISIWDDPDAWIESFNGAPESLRQRQLATTRRRGGLRKVVDRAIRGRFGMSLTEYEQKVRAAQPGYNAVMKAHRVLRAVAGFAEDGVPAQGFDKADAGIASALAATAAEIVAVNPAYAALVVDLSQKYR